LDGERGRGLVLLATGQGERRRRNEQGRDPHSERTESKGRHAAHKACVSLARPRGGVKYPDRARTSAHSYCWARRRREGLGGGAPRRCSALHRRAAATLAYGERC